MSNIVHEALNLLCGKHATIEKFFKQTRALKKACKKNFEISCPKHSVCDFKPSKFTKKNKRSFPPVRSSSKRQGKFRFFRKKFQRKCKTDRYYLCKQQGHFAKNCLRKKAKSTKMVFQLMINHHDSNIESIYSEQSRVDDDTVFALEDSASSSENDELYETSLPIFTMSQHTNSSISILVNTISQIDDSQSPQPVLLT
jgi:hypothetical protein